MTNMAEPAELEALVQFPSHCQPSNTEMFSILFMFDDQAKLSYLINSGAILSSLQKAQQSLFAIYIRSGQSLPVHCLSNIYFTLNDLKKEL